MRVTIGTRVAFTTLTIVSAVSDTASQLERPTLSPFGMVRSELILRQRRAYRLRQSAPGMLLR